MCPHTLMLEHLSNHVQHYVLCKLNVHCMQHDIYVSTSNSPSSVLSRWKKSFLFFLFFDHVSRVNWECTCVGAIVFGFFDSQAQIMINYCHICHISMHKVAKAHHHDKLSDGSRAQTMRWRTLMTTNRLKHTVDSFKCDMISAVIC